MKTNENNIQYSHDDSSGDSSLFKEISKFIEIKKALPEDSTPLQEPETFPELTSSKQETPVPESLADPKNDSANDQIPFEKPRDTSDSLTGNTEAADQSLEVQPELSEIKLQMKAEQKLIKDDADNNEDLGSLSEKEDQTTDSPSRSSGTEMPEAKKSWFTELDAFQEAKDGIRVFGEKRTEADKTLVIQSLEHQGKESGGSALPSSPSTWNIPFGNKYSDQSQQDEIPTIPPAESSGSNGFEVKRLLPNPVTEIDQNPTILTPSAFTPNDKVNKNSTQPIRIQESRKSSRKKNQEKEQTRPFLAGQTPTEKRGRSQKAVIILLSFLMCIILLMVTFGMIQYFRLASGLPEVNELRLRASQFETTRILDRNGNILYEVVDPNAGKRTYVPLEKISPYLIAATLATEDKEYYNHPGFDLMALGRALWSNYTTGEIVSGASTITQQLARMLLLADERFEQSYDRKAREIILAAEITRRYTKDEVLELYLNEIFYGNLSYGIEAAAETYFNTTAADLQLWQASFLAGLPQTPATYDIYQNRELTLNRNKTVLVLMYELSSEKNCIYIGEARDRVCVDAVQALEASEILEAYTFEQKDFVMRFPHWVVYIQSLLEEQFDPQTIYRSGFTVYTTLDPNLQKEAQTYIQDQLAGMVENNATNGAVVAIDPNTGEILAMVGSADFYNEQISGQVNMATTETRQPGSSIKPLTYLAAFEKDWTPSTLIWDVPTSFSPSGKPDDPAPAYEPVNYDGRFHGPVTVRYALANSYNVPAVKALQYVGIYDDPETSEADGFINMAKRLGITSLTRDDYGLSLTLGGGEVSLLEMTGAYAVLANEGSRVAPVAINKVVDFTGQTVFEYSPPKGDQVVRQAHAYLISLILSDTDARIPAFGANSVLNLPFQVAVKTGTTNDYRDNWTIGYTPDLVVGVWVGNADYSAMINTSGVSGAGPIWSKVMQYGIETITNGNPTWFDQPDDVIDEVVCSVSGARPSEWCPEHRVEFFASDQMPLPKSKDLWVKQSIDTWTGLTASSACSEFTKDVLVANVQDKSAIRWLRKTEAGKQWAKNYGFSDPIVIIPSRECRVDDPRAIIDIIGLSDGQTVKENPLKINGVIDATANFKEFRIDYGEGEKPKEWKVLVDWKSEPVRAADEIYSWDLSDIESRIVTIRITMRSTEGTKVEKRYVVTLEIPTPTPTMTPIPTETQTPEPTYTPTYPPTETPTPLPSPTPTETVPTPIPPVPSATP